MQCPRCKAYGLSCKDSRPDGETIRRRRQCLNCGYRFTTYEISTEDYAKLKNNEALVADVVSYLDDFFKKVNERTCDNEN